MIEEEACIGCGLCEIHCFTQHSKSKDIIKAYKKEYPRPAIRISLEISKPISFAVQCRHCENPPCVMSCLSGAMHIDNRTGQVLHDSEKCIGCWTCIMVCSYGAVVKDASGRKIVAKCDLCPDIDIPACVANCPNEALRYEEVYT
jgi:carbon-monoxide dehydrogenase iron sulfur subunit